MITLSKEKIKEIAENLDVGLKCYYNKKTHEVVDIIDFDNNYGADTSEFEDLIDDLEINFRDYYEFERMSSRESFQVMEDFLGEVDDEEFRKRLIWSLNRSHPFRNFKDEIDYNGEYREKWFKFKASKYIEYVEGQIREYNEVEKFKREEEGPEGKDDLVK